MALLLFEDLWSSENSKSSSQSPTEHSFSRAAIKLCRTQPAVSQAVRRLEEDLGERLVRSQHEVREAHAGRRCAAARSDPIAPNGRRSGGHGPAVVAAGPRGPADWRRRTRRSHPAAGVVDLPLQQPHVSVEFRRVADLDVLAEVGAGTIDIGITTRERVPAPLSSVPVPVPVCRLLRPAAKETPLCVLARAADDDSPFRTARHAGWCATAGARIDLSHR